MKYDDASWHSGGEFPSDLPPSAGATHIAMFAAWAVLHGFAGQLHLTELADKLQSLKERTVTPTTWFLAACDGKLTSEDFTEEGNAFARDYYVTVVDNKQVFGPYYDDCDEASGGKLATYRVPDTWETYDKVDAIVSERLIEWKNFRRGQP